MKKIDYLDIIKHNLDKRNISVNIYDELPFHGEYDFCNKSINIKKDKYFFYTLLHEYSHVLQKEKNNIWRYGIYKNKMAHDHIDGWINNDIYYADYELRYIFSKAIAIEKDCEEIAISIIKENNIDLDIDQYIKRVNSCLFYFNYQYNTKSKLIKAPYEYKEIIDSMPKNLQNNYFNNSFMEVFESVK
tara:strand:- start:8202 stop:8765 length:564 start_codon:yes stop_codon:yes gene_type:complete